MKCALQALAASRASVVLPLPGGPQSTIECATPSVSSRCSGRPGREQVGLAGELRERLRAHAIRERAVARLVGASIGNSDCLRMANGF